MRTDTAQWNPTPGYTQIALQYLGRVWQLGSNPKALQQIQLHADYYRHYIEPSGQMDNGSAPHIKHDWAAPYTNSVLGVELVRRYADTPDFVLQSIADRAHEALRSPTRGLHTRWMIYWLAADTEQRETLPMDFVREAPEINGFQTRVTNELGTLTVYATGRESARDTRLSAIGSGANGERDSDSALVGVFVEYIRNDVSYFMGEMQPKIVSSVDPDKRTASLIVTQNRRSMGAEAKPLFLGDFMGSIKKWTQDCWRGGSPIVNPITSTETWLWNDDQLNGTISVTALQDSMFDEVRITLPFLHHRIDEQETSPGYAAVRSGNLCVQVRGAEGTWTTSVSPEGELIAISPAPDDGILQAGTMLKVDISICLGTSLQSLVTRP